MKSVGTPAGRMMRFDIQSPAARKALRDAKHNISIGFMQKLTVEQIKRLDQPVIRRKRNRK